MLPGAEFILYKSVIHAEAALLVRHTRTRCATFHFFRFSTVLLQSELIVEPTKVADFI